MPDIEKPTKLSGGDKRITSIILNHWEAVRGEKQYPAEADLDPAVLEPVLDNCFLIKIEGLLEGKYQYKFLGKNVMNAYGSDLTRRLNTESDPLSQKEKILEVLNTKRPVIDEGEFVNTKQNLVKYRQCLMPLSSDGVNIDSIFGGIRFIVLAIE
jgi:hypothetical protein